MIYLGSERIITNNYSNHITAEDYAGNHLSDISINSACKVIKIIDKFKSHEDSINYNDFLNNQNNWREVDYYNCISITGKRVRMTSEELGGNQIHLETIHDNKKYIIKLCHLNDVVVNIGNIIKPNQLLGHQGNTGLVLSSKQISDSTYGSHVHIEVLNESNNFINPRELADGSISGNYISQSNELNNKVNQIKILADSINIREEPRVDSLDIGNVYINEIYDVLDIIDNDYIWYKINTNTDVIGYVASSKTDKWIEYIPRIEEQPIEEIENNDNLKLIYTCSKEDYYYLKMYEGESLYIKKQD